MTFALAVCDANSSEKEDCTMFRGVAQSKKAPFFLPPWPIRQRRVDRLGCGVVLHFLMARFFFMACLVTFVFLLAFFTQAYDVELFLEVDCTCSGISPSWPPLLHCAPSQNTAL